MRRFAVIGVLSVLAFGITLQAKEKPNNNLVVGAWKCMAHGGENGDVPFTLYLSQSGDVLTGSVSSSQGDAELSSVTFEDNQLKIDIDTDENKYTLTATLTDGGLTGSWYRDGQKQGTWEGKK
jgi:hypothetical protein